MAKYKAENERDRCVACGVCVKVCPRDAISIHKGCYAVVDENLCIGCGICRKLIRIHGLHCIVGSAYRIDCKAVCIKCNGRSCRRFFALSVFRFECLNKLV